MSEKEPAEIIARQPAGDTFSVAPLQREVDKQLGASERRVFTLADLRRLSKMAHRALREADTDNPYTTEVMIPMRDGDYVYDMQAEPPQRVERPGEVLYGFVDGFMVTVPEGAQQEVFAAALEVYSDDVTEENHSYLVPMAVNGTNFGVRMVDAPSPVAENGVEVATQDMHDVAKEDTEQDTIHSLLNIIENDLFEEDTIATDVLEESIESLRRAGFIENLDDMTTACNYYLQMCLHNVVNVWKVNLDSVMERLDGTEPGRSTVQWVSDELIVVGVDLAQVEIEEKGKKKMSVQCTVYARSEEGCLYRSCQHDTGEHLVLFRKEDNEDDEDEAE